MSKRNITPSYCAGYKFGVRDSSIHEFSHCAIHLKQVAERDGHNVKEFTDGYKAAEELWLEVKSQVDFL